MIHEKDIMVAPHIAEHQNPAVTGIIPEGYMTGDEFAKQVKSELTRLYTQYGFLQ